MATIFQVSALSGEEVAMITRLAEREQRTLSAMAAVLLREALGARGEEVPPKVAAKS